MRSSTRLVARVARDGEARESQAAFDGVCVLFTDDSTVTSRTLRRSNLAKGIRCSPPPPPLPSLLIPKKRPQVVRRVFDIHSSSAGCHVQRAVTVITLRSFRPGGSMLPLLESEPLQTASLSPPPPAVIAPKTSVPPLPTWRSTRCRACSCDDAVTAAPPLTTQLASAPSGCCHDSLQSVNLLLNDHVRVIVEIVVPIVLENILETFSEIVLETGSESEIILEIIWKSIMTILLEIVAEIATEINSL